MSRRGEAGLTLIELLVSVVIAGILLGALSQATFLGLRTMDATNQRIAGSNDTQLIASYFMSDVASAEAVSATGTTSHAAPSVTTSAANTELVGFWTLKTGTTMTPPDGMTEGWDVASTGPTPTSRITVSMADELNSPIGASGNRVAESVDGTSSLAHTVALSPAGSPAITRRDASSGSTAGAGSLTLSRPTLTQSGDVMLAQVAVAGGTGTPVTAPTGWTLVESRDSGTAVKSLVYSRTATSIEPLNWTWIFMGNPESAGGVAAYSGASGVNAHANETNPCGGETPVLLLNWTDRGTSLAHEVSYTFQAVTGENQLQRLHCTGTSGAPVDRETLARNLAPSASVTAACQPVGCGPLTSPVSVTITLSEPPAPHQTTGGRVYQLRGTTRTTS
jgi:prepilin-type N-terminal cleavage/methylation domain-containing protein